MEKLNLNEVKEFVNTNIVTFHENKIKTLENLDLRKILKAKNPYLFKAKNVTLASELILSILDAYLSSSEEKIFGDFLEKLAVFISLKTCKGRKSAVSGVDLEFTHKNMHHLISIKSGPNWANSSQLNALENNFKTAVTVLRQSHHTPQVQPVLGICYGKTRTTTWRGIALKVVGQNFWYYISENENLYTDIIEPLGYRAEEHNDKFLEEKGRVLNLFTQEFLEDFCVEGNIDWERLVKFNSGNLDLMNG